jgi:hypothetical protein
MMETTETTELAGLTPPQIEELWQEALVPAERIAQRIYAKRASARRYRKAGGHYVAQAEKIEAEAEALKQGALQEAKQVEEPFIAEWKRRGGWTRYFLVSGGHLHALPCSTLTPGLTLVGLIAEASGLTEEQVVAKYQYTACTHCFKAAPVEPKLTIAEQGLCEHSGQYVEGVEGASVRPQWWSYAVLPTASCPCGFKGAITRSGKFRKHKAGG